ncbi:aminodeoxychorismate synthase component 1 [Gottschalkia purinilytica]|uniref:Anthranilate synthase component 1 n=1 Tax=Gottschalkia purinilytica TaxID=1503 RepID=A0A0L0W9A7_GOTPU|nr:anthranilate synthase component I [Gottschalkia purinilytica]KNF08138.1 aminodeoxychorismate synthase component 1 [Gottschalkia purinilytica]
MTNVSKERFEVLKGKKIIFPVITEFSGDQTTPINIFYNLDGKYKFLLESAYIQDKGGRYSFIGENPVTTIKSNQNIINISKDGEKEKTLEGKILDFISEYIKVDYENLEVDIPFVGGALGYIGYDIVRQFETISSKNKKEINVPEAYLLLYKTVICYDHFKRTISIIYNVYPEDTNSYEEIIQKINDIYTKISKIPEIRDAGESKKEKDIKSNFNKEDFCLIVDKAKEYINKGEVLQVVVSQRFATETDSDPFDVYRRLRTINPSPYLFYIDYEDFQIVGASPESLVSVKESKVTANPIAGTRRRGRTLEEDLALREELLNDPKERLEHDMLVELEKEDLSKICEEGSIEVERYMALENYSHVMHLVATVSGKLRNEFDSFDALRACFPAGTVSGAPRVKAMEIIEELENVQREVYSGAVGYFSLNGNMDVCIAIRSIIFKDKKAYFQAGAGIVRDSKPENEYKETLNKAKVLTEVI